MASSDEKVVKVGRLKTFFADLKSLFAAKSHTHDDYLPLSGGTLSGNLTGKYITGTWLQATASNHTPTKQSKVVVQDSGGWLYSRTPDELRADIGAASTSVATAGSDGLMSAEDKKKLDSSGGGSNAPTLVPDVFELEDLAVQGGEFENAGEGWNTFTFPEPFDEVPLVLAQCEGYGVDVKGVTAERFLYMVTQATSSAATTKTLYLSKRYDYVFAKKQSSDGGSFDVLTSAGSSGTSGVADAVTVRWAAMEKGGE